MASALHVETNAEMLRQNVEYIVDRKGLVQKIIATRGARRDPLLLKSAGPHGNNGRRSAFCGRLDPAGSLQSRP